MDAKVTSFDVAEHLDEQGQRELLEDALASSDPHYVAHALGIIARAKGMTQVERDTGMNRQQLYRTLSSKGNPTISTLMKVLESLGMKLTVAA